MERLWGVGLRKILKKSISLVVAPKGGATGRIDSVLSMAVNVRIFRGGDPTDKRPLCFFWGLGGIPSKRARSVQRSGLHENSPKLRSTCSKFYSLKPLRIHLKIYLYFWKENRKQKILIERNF